MIEATVILGFCLIVVAGAANAVMDIIQHKFKASIFSEKEDYEELFWNPKFSWKNKYRYDNNTKKLKEKFLGSTTVFVWTTDAWHLFQFVMLNSYSIAFFLLGIAGLNLGTKASVILFISASIVFRVVFELFYSFILVKRNDE